MIIRVPLVLQPSVAVIHRLDVTATRAVDPEGEPTTGYDERLREPIAFNAVGGDRTTARSELAALRVPCQIESATEEMLREFGLGDAPATSMVLVFHRKTLEEQSLLDANRECILKKGDRVSAFERYGAASGFVIKQLREPGLYVTMVQGRSWGFGPDGYDLELVLLTDRREGAN